MDTRSMTGEPKRVTVVCPTCRNRNELTVSSGVPVAQCVVCGTRLTARINGPLVVSR
jgi:Zn ribbon nucleic-acid-binding protein